MDLILYIGEGAGYNYGEQLRKIGSSEINSNVKNFAWGIQVQTGIEFMLTENLGFKWELRFRVPEFEMSNSYNS